MHYCDDTVLWSFYCLLRMLCGSRNREYNVLPEVMTKFMTTQKNAASPNITCILIFHWLIITIHCFALRESIWSCNLSVSFLRDLCWLCDTRIFSQLSRVAYPMETGHAIKRKPYYCTGHLIWSNAIISYARTSIAYSVKFHFDNLNT